MPTNITFSLFILSLLEADNFCLQYDRVTDREEPQEPAILNRLYPQTFFLPRPHLNDEILNFELVL